ncbi:MAG: RluA family pseudouridine synthase [Pseudomonadota bacterium]|nr:RluA family pseudouridine synthase [Pseudomonadota bacterium]
MTFVPEIIFSNNDVVVVNKPYGMLVHEDWHSGVEGTLVEWFLENYPEAKGVGEEALKPDGTPLERSGIVHRLDRETSGVMILARNKEAHAFIKSQFHDRQAKKEYRAFVYGQIHDKWGTINRPIGRNSKDFKKRSAEKGAKGVLREAITHFERIGFGEYKGEPFSYLKLLPQTGRTHQLRVHLRAIDRPIVGDPLYAEKRIAASNNLDLNRLALHAHVLEIILPHGQTERFIAPLPLEFEQAAERIAD